MARGLGEAGAVLVLNGRNSARLEQAADILRGEGFQVHTRNFDVTQAGAVRAAIEDIEAGIGAIDILVNNAGMQKRMPLQDFPEEDWQN